MMYELFLYSLKACACTGVFYIFYKLLLAKETYHRINRTLLLIGFLVSFLLPVLVITVTQVVTIVETSNEIVITETSVTNETEIKSIIIDDLLGIVYIAGVIAMLVRLATSVRMIMRKVRNGERTRLEDGTILITTNDNCGAFSWLRYIVISKYEDESEAKLIKLHEHGHIKMHHTYDLLLIDILGSLQWYNPFMWMLRSELKNIHEFEADNYVLSTGADAKEYQLLLIKKAVGASRYSVANSFNHNKLKVRITMMLNKKSSKLARAKALLMLPLLCMGVMAFAETNYVYAADKGSEKSLETVRNDSIKVLYLVDGVKTESVDGIIAADIAETTVLKGSDAAMYGSYDQVIDITTKKNVKDITIKGTVKDEDGLEVLGTVKDEDGLEVLGAVVRVWKGEGKTMTDRLGSFTLKAKNTDIISVSHAGYRTVNMKAKENMAFVLKYESPDSTSLSSAVGIMTTATNAIRNNLQGELVDINEEIEESKHAAMSPSTSTSTSTSTSVSTSDDKSKVVKTTRTTVINNDGSKNISSSVSYDVKDKGIIIKNENNKPILVTNNGTNLKDPTVYVDGKKVESLNDLNLKSDKILSISVEPDNKILITLKKEGVKYPTQKEIVKAQKHLNGKGKKYYVTTHEGTTDVIRAKNDDEAIRYCQTHYKKNVLLLKRPNGGVIKVVKPIK